MFWVGTPCSDVVGYQRTSPWRWWQHDPPKRWYPTATLHGVTTHKTSTRKRVTLLSPLSIQITCTVTKWKFLLDHEEVIRTVEVKGRCISLWDCTTEWDGLCTLSYAGGESQGPGSRYDRVTTKYVKIWQQMIRLVGFIQHSRRMKRIRNRREGKG
jgi:hypothetical protein